MTYKSKIEKISDRIEEKYTRKNKQIDRNSLEAAVLSMNINDWKLKDIDLKQTSIGETSYRKYPTPRFLGRYCNIKEVTYNSTKSSLDIINLIKNSFKKIKDKKYNLDLDDPLKDYLKDKYKLDGNEELLAATKFHSNRITGYLEKVIGGVLGLLYSPIAYMKYLIEK